jgi:hypothetical protein
MYTIEAYYLFCKYYNKLLIKQERASVAYELHEKKTKIEIDMISRTKGGDSTIVQQREINQKSNKGIVSDI